MLGLSLYGELCIFSQQIELYSQCVVCSNAVLADNIGILLTLIGHVLCVAALDAVLIGVGKRLHYENNV